MTRGTIALAARKNKSPAGWFTGTAIPLERPMETRRNSALWKNSMVARRMDRKWSCFSLSSWPVIPLSVRILTRSIFTPRRTLLTILPYRPGQAFPGSPGRAAAPRDNRAARPWLAGRGKPLGQPFSPYMPGRAKAAPRPLAL